MKKILFLLLLILLLTDFCLTAQDIMEELGQPAEMSPSERLSLAISNENYPVTPGDIYQLNYQPAEEIMTILIPVETDYSLDLGILGTIAGYGLTFPQLKQKVEKKFSAAYPQSTPSFTIYSLSIFQVFITGEVPRARFVNAWGLSRLGEILKGNMGPYSSIRNVTVESNRGKTDTYDLFKGLTLGDSKHNPYVKSGDTIIISRREKQVVLKGEIYRPGTYEILKTDTFSDIINVYGDNFTKIANTGYIRVERTLNNTLELLKYDEIAKKKADSILKDGDIINVEPVFKETPVIFIEGAIRDISEEEEGVDEEPGHYMHHLIVKPFFTGDTLYDVMNKIKDLLLSDADLSHSYLLRESKDQVIPVNLQALLYNRDISSNHKMENFDRIIIPRKKMFVIVNGDVRNPGTYSFVPNQKYTYYLGLAGGIVNGGIEENTTFIIDNQGNQKSIQDSINIGDTIIIKRATVIVSGAVASPGEYPFVPGKLYYYFVNLAGGINYDKNDGGSVIITDSKHNKKKKKDTINSGDTIFVPSSGFSYNFNKYMTIIATTLSIVVSSILIWNELSPSSNGN